jgi:hypothetical protein
VESVARVLAVDAAELVPSVDPPAPAGDLRSELDHFTTLEACVEQRARLDPLVGDALDAIGYDTFLRDACEVIDAAKADDPKRCQAIEASALQAHCLATVAEVGGNPDGCPWRFVSQPTKGRDAACVAIASRDPRLCAAESDSRARATCEAVIARSSARCRQLFSRQERDRCARSVERWRAVLPRPDRGREPEGGGPFVVAGSLRVKGSGNGGVAGDPMDVGLGPDVARGVVLIEQRDGVRVTVGPLTDDGPGFLVRPPHVPATFGLEIFVPSSASSPDGTPRIERAELIMPGRPALATPGVTSNLALRIEALKPARGGAIKFVVDGDLGSHDMGVHLHAEEATFVCDVVKLAGPAHALPRPRERMSPDSGGP